MSEESAVHPNNMNNNNKGQEKIVQSKAGQIPHNPLLCSHCVMSRPALRLIGRVIGAVSALVALTFPVFPLTLLLVVFEEKVEATGSKDGVFKSEPLVVETDEVTSLSRAGESKVDVQL